MSFTPNHPPSDLPPQPSPQRSTHTLIFHFEVGSDILISVGIVWPFPERIIVRMNALSHITVHNVIPLPSRPNCAEYVLTEALDPLEMLHKAFPVANHETNSADMLATCFALQCCHAGSIKGIGTTSDAASQANPNSTSLNLENRPTLSTRNECAMSERAVTRSVAGQWSASCVCSLDGSGNSVDDVKVAVGLLEGSFGCWEAGDAHRATPHPRQPASPASPLGTHGRMMREVVGRLQVRGQLDGRDRRIVSEHTHHPHSDSTASRAGSSEDCSFVVEVEED